MSEALAGSLGAHPLAWFVAALCVVFLAAGTGWRLGSRYLMRPVTNAPLSSRRVALCVAIGFAIVVGAAIAFSEIAREIGEGEEIVRFDERIALAIGRSTAPAALRVFSALTHLGDALTLTLLCTIVASVLVAIGRQRLAFGWVVALAGGGVLNETLKHIFERVPPLYGAGSVEIPSWSFPSGHTSGAVVAYGMLAYILTLVLPARWHLPIVATAAALAFTIGSSRIFLQVHYASDVAAGFLSGSAWLAISVLSVELARRYPR